VKTVTNFPKRFAIKVKPNSNRTEYNGVDDNGRHLVSIKEKAEDNKANIALVKFFKKEFKLNIRIKSGLKSKDKILETILPI
jgi:uncharacterized protein (TIGR00251 family)